MKIRYVAMVEDGTDMAVVVEAKQEKTCDICQGASDGLCFKCKGAGTQESSEPQIKLFDGHDAAQEYVQGGRLGVVLVCDEKRFRELQLDLHEGRIITNEFQPD